MSTTDPLADVAFLARSPHRVDVLQCLADGPLTRPELNEATGISQPTLGRVLSAFEERNWVERRDRTYALTAWGRLLADEFSDLLDTVATIQRLDGVLELLPTDEMAFDVRHLGSATITTPAPGDVFRHVRRAESLFANAERLRILGDTIAPGSLGDLHDRIVSGDGDLLAESIITAEAMDHALADPDLVAWIRDLLESDRAPVYRYDGAIPMTMALADDLVLLAPTDDHGVPGALVESDDPVVREWVEAEFETYRAQATELTVDDLPS